MSRQIELTPLRKRLALAVGIGIAAALVAGFFALRSSHPIDNSVVLERDALASKVRSMEEKLQKQELELTVRENRLQEMEQSLARAAMQPQATTETNTPASGPRTGHRVAREGPLTPLRDSEEALPAGPARGEQTEDVAERAPSPRASAGRTPSARSVVGPMDQGGSSAPPSEPAMAFDAQEMTAVASGPNQGKLQFRLVKDHPKVRFSGFLFVFVQMVDKRGDRKIFAYPKRTKLGEGDLPRDFRSGESLAFKFNSNVELPYADSRTNATLSEVTVLLYNEDGSIVFQRQFDRKALKIVSAHATKAEGVQAPQPPRKRQAL